MIRFAVISDLHFCMFPAQKNMSGSAMHDDRPRYAEITKSSIPILLDDIEATKPDFVICCGDIVEGGHISHDQALYEAKCCINEFKKRNLNLISIKGTHEKNDVYKKVILKNNSSFINNNIQNNYFYFSNNNSHFICIDYLDFAENSDQRKWIRETLSSIPKKDHVFVFSHAPLFLMARPFFSNTFMIDFMKKIINENKIDIFFCGHTHNQTISAHKNEKKSFFQIKVSSTGFIENTLVPLEYKNKILSEQEYLWGFAEGSRPGWWLIEKTNRNLSGTYYSVGNKKIGGFVKEKNKKNLIIKPPNKEKEFQPHMLSLIRNASLHTKATGLKGDEVEISLNGRNLGYIPANTSWADRRDILLSREDIILLKEKNILELKIIKQGNWAIGSFHIFAELYNESILYSEVVENVYLGGNSGKGYTFENKIYKKINKQQGIRLHLDFKNCKNILSRSICQKEYFK